MDDDRELPRRAPGQTTKDNRVFRRVLTNLTACTELLELGPEQEIPVEGAEEN